MVVNHSFSDSSKDNKANISKCYPLTGLKLNKVELSHCLHIYLLRGRPRLKGIVSQPPFISPYFSLLPHFQSFQAHFTPFSIYSGSLLFSGSLLPHFQSIQAYFFPFSIYSGSLLPIFNLFRLTSPSSLLSPNL